MKRWEFVALLMATLSFGGACENNDRAPPQSAIPIDDDDDIDIPEACEEAPRDPFIESAEKVLLEGRRIFRTDTFGSEAFWGGMLRLHESVQTLPPVRAMELGLKVDVDALPDSVIGQIKDGTIDLQDPATTLALLELDAVIGVTGFFAEVPAQAVTTAKRLESIGIQCTLCHATVDDSLAPGIGHRLDGWPNRDLDIGAIVATAPTLEPIAALLGVDEETVRQVLMSWGPGKYDAELVLDARPFRPDGRSGATVLPAAFGLAGVNLHTYTGWGSVTYWNAYVAITQMHGQGTFYDPRLADAERFPIAARAGFNNIRPAEDRVTAKLAALHMYQLAIEPPLPPAGSFDPVSAERGRLLFNSKAECARCHVPPLFTEPGYNMHFPEEIGIDGFQASRSPDGMYRTTPLRGLFTRMKGGFYHDGRFATLRDVIVHYERHFDLGLTDDERMDLEEYLKSL